MEFGNGKPMSLLRKAMSPLLSPSLVPAAAENFRGLQTEHLRETSTRNKLEEVAVEPLMILLWNVGRTSRLMGGKIDAHW